MTARNCTATPADSKNINYPTRLSNATVYAVAEDSDDYSSTPANSEAFIKEIKCIEMWSLEFATVGQIERLYNLASQLLQQAKSGEHAPAQIETCALEVRKTGRQLETLLHKMVHTIVNELTTEDKGPHQDYGVFTEDDD